MSLSQLNAEISIEFICSDIYFYNITDKLQHFISFCFKICILGIQLTEIENKTKQKNSIHWANISPLPERSKVFVKMGPYAEAEILTFL